MAPMDHEAYEQRMYADVDTLQLTCLRQLHTQVRIGHTDIFEGLTCMRARARRGEMRRTGCGIALSYMDRIVPHAHTRTWWLLRSLLSKDRYPRRLNWVVFGPSPGPGSATNTSTLVAICDTR